MIKIAIIDDQKSDLKYISNEVKNQLDAKKSGMIYFYIQIHRNCWLIMRRTVLMLYFLI